MNELFEFEYNALQEMLIVNHQEGFSYNMSYEDDVFSVATKLNEQQATIKRLEEENDDLRFALRTEQAFARVEKDKKPFLSKEKFLKELEEDE